MNRWNTTKMARAFGDDEIEVNEEESVDAPTDAGGQTTEADYSFEGYSVELLDKVALMPIAPATQRT
jgi:hypothetical protein